MKYGDGKAISFHFVWIFAILLGALFYAYGDKHSHAEQMLEILEYNKQAMEKIRHYSNLIEYSRTRIQLTSMILSKQNIFEKDQINQKVEEYAGRFAATYQSLRQLQLNAFEQQKLREWEAIVMELLPAQRRAVSLSMHGGEDGSREAFNLLFNTVIPKQNQAIGLFHELLQYYQLDTENFLVNSEKHIVQHEQKHMAMMLAFIIFSAIMAALVIRRNYSFQQHLKNSQKILKKTVREKTEALRQKVRELDFQQKALNEHAIVSITDASGRITYANEKFMTISGYSIEELLGRNHHIINSGEHPEEFFANLWQTISKGDVWQGIIKNRTKNGYFYWVKSTIVPFLDDDGKPFKYISIRTDITDRVKVEQELAQAYDMAEQASEAKSQFLSLMSHEIRTPMNAILGFSELVLLDDSLKADSRSNVQHVYDSAQSLLSIINDVLDLTKIEKGKLILESIHYDLHELFEQSIKMLRGQAEKKALYLRLTIATDVPREVTGDPNRLRQVIINLVGNAIKFTDQGGVDVQLKRATDPQVLEMHISDTGIGIAEDKLEHIFDSFYQADISVSRRFGGTGLGTHIAKQIIDMMGGDIQIESQPGKGTIFHVSFQWADEKAAAIAATVSDTAESHASSLPDDSQVTEKPDSPTRLLVVEDNTFNQELLRQQIESIGYSCEIAENGEQALEKLAEKPYQLVLSDISMPVMDGYQLLKAIRANEAGSGRHLTVIAVTAHAMSGEREKCLSLGFDDFCGKPVKKEHLKNLLDKWLNTQDDN